MDVKEILKRCDHTQLSPTATWEDIRQLCDEGMKYGTASVCIAPAYVKAAKGYVGDRSTVCTVIGFPLGYSTTGVKCLEAETALRDGADEIDMVLNIGALCDGRYDEVREEIRAVKAVCGQHILKVIIETCLLSEEQKIAACHLVTEAGADYIKTSTGFSHGGATRSDVALLRKHVGVQVKVKAAGGISTLEDAWDMIALGADRLGTSRIVRLVEQTADANESSY